MIDKSVYSHLSKHLLKTKVHTYFIRNLCVTLKKRSLSVVIIWNIHTKRLTKFMTSKKGVVTNVFFAYLFCEVCKSCSKIDATITINLGCQRFSQFISIHSWWTRSTCVACADFRIKDSPPLLVEDVFCCLFTLWMFLY